MWLERTVRGRRARADHAVDGVPVALCGRELLEHVPVNRRCEQKVRTEGGNRRAGQRGMGRGEQGRLESRDALVGERGERHLRIGPDGARVLALLADDVKGWCERMV